MASGLKPRSSSQSIWRAVARAWRIENVPSLIAASGAVCALLATLVGPWALLVFVPFVPWAAWMALRHLILGIQAGMRGLPLDEYVRRKSLAAIAPKLGLQIDPAFPNHAEGFYEGRALTLRVDYQGVHAALLTPLRDFETLNVTCGELEEIARGELSGVDARLYTLYGEALSGQQRDALLDLFREFPHAILELSQGELLFHPLHPKSVNNCARALIETLHQTLRSFESYVAEEALSGNVAPHQYFCRKKLEHIAKIVKGRVQHEAPDQADASYAGRDYVLELRDGRVAVRLSTTFRGRDLTVDPDGSFVLAPDYKLTGTDASYALFERALDTGQREALLALLRAHPGAKLKLTESGLRLWPTELSSLAKEPTALVATLPKTLVALERHSTDRPEHVSESP